MSTVFVGLMSGTSLDGVDAVAADFGPDPATTSLRVLAHARCELPAPLRAELLALNTPGSDELHRGALAANQLVRLYAQAIDGVLSAARLDAGEVRAVGCHGQTVRHRPGEFDGTGYTVQLDAPALLAELCGVDVVADFRSRDVAAGGQGAPLVPAFHRAVFARPGESVAVLNLGGIANLSCIDADGATLGFDCGPANALIDVWCAESTGRAFDAGGCWAASGRVDARLLDVLAAEPYFDRPAPKSTGRDLFHRRWLQTALSAAGADDRLAAEDVQATLAELTGTTCAAACRRYCPAASELIVCGGGALNADLLRRLRRLLSPMRVVVSDERGLPAEQVEATAFAWLARAFVHRLPGNVAAATGAAGPRILGALYPR
ncbi:MAG: anhydro-N-acetylmuramic acid kinase [Caldimonas sp.]